MQCQKFVEGRRQEIIFLVKGTKECMIIDTAVPRSDYITISAIELIKQLYLFLRTGTILCTICVS